MQYWRCKCGKRRSFGQLSPPKCRGCEECGTTLARHPDYHEEPQDHEWTETMVMTDEGEKPLTVCAMCSRPKHEIEDEDS